MNIVIPLTLFAMMLILALLLSSGRGGGQTVEEQMRRIASEAETPTEIDIARRTTPKGNEFIHRWLSHLHLLNSLELMIMQAGLYFSASQILVIMLLLAATGGVAGAALQQNLLLAAPCALGFAFLPLVYLKIGKRQRVKAFGQQLPEVLDLLKSLLQAG